MTTLFIKILYMMTREWLYNKADKAQQSGDKEKALKILEYQTMLENDMNHAYRFGQRSILKDIEILKD